MRDDFPLTVKELLAKRVAQRCANPGCRKPTSGPQVDPSKAINIGVAAHITAASPDGPRYDPSLTPQQRIAADNGIWLCQSCGKLADNDQSRYTVDHLREWKCQAEAVAVRDLERPLSRDDSRDEMFARLERLMPELLYEMRNDLIAYPLKREFVVFRKGLVYNSRGSYLVYHPDEHTDLASKLRILENHGLITEITYNNTPRYVMSEQLASYLGAP